MNRSYFDDNLDVAKNYSEKFDYLLAWRPKHKSFLNSHKELLSNRNVIGFFSPSEKMLSGFTNGLQAIAYMLFVCSVRNVSLYGADMFLGEKFHGHSGREKSIEERNVAKSILGHDPISNFMLAKHAVDSGVLIPKGNAEVSLSLTRRGYCIALEHRLSKFL